MRKMQNIILLSHRGCPDGFGSAYAFWKKFGDTIEYYPILHHEPIPDIKGKHVFMADIAFDKETMHNIYINSHSFIVLDHHISRYNELQNEPYYIYSDGHSGAVMSWNYLFPNQEAPLILKLIETRDLWKWDIENAKELLAVLDSLPFTFEAWD